MSHRKGAVNTQMKGFPEPSAKGTAGIYGRNKPPFDQPKSMGGGGLEEKFFTEPFGTVVPATTLTQHEDPRKRRGKPE